MYDMSNSANILDGNVGVGGSGDHGNDGLQKILRLPVLCNVDTLMGIERIVNSIIPQRAPGNYLKSNIGTNPYLYLWITTTLILCVAISGNIFSYLQHANDS